MNTMEKITRDPSLFLYKFEDISRYLNQVRRHLSTGNVYLKTFLVGLNEGFN